MLQFDLDLGMRVDVEKKVVPWRNQCDQGHSSCSNGYCSLLRWAGPRKMRLIIGLASSKSFTLPFGTPTGDVWLEVGN